MVQEDKELYFKNILTKILQQDVMFWLKEQKMTK